MSLISAGSISLDSTFKVVTSAERWIIFRIVFAIEDRSLGVGVFLHSLRQSFYL